MRKVFLLFALSLLTTIGAGAQTQQQGTAARQRLLGEVTAVDAATRQVTLRADSGETVTLTTSEQTTYLRMPPGETKLENGQPAAFADVRVGDRVLAPGVSAAGGAASRIILMARPAGGGGGAREEGRRLNGRVLSVDAGRRLIVVQTRGREAVEAVTIDASGDVRFLRFAPDSTRPADAVAGSIADVRVGDTLRATGERAADGGATFKAAEVLSGSFTRFAGTVTSVDASRNELIVRNEQTGQNVTLNLGTRSGLRRVTPEFEQAVAQQRAERAERVERREQRRAGREGGAAQGEARGGREGRRDGERAEGRRGDGERRGGANFQQMFETLPAVALSDLKKGDAVIVTATQGADASRGTLVSLVTGGAEFLRGMQQFGRGEGQRGMSPGLPGDVIGGGQGGTREPPR